MHFRNKLKLISILLLIAGSVNAALIAVYLQIFIHYIHYSLMSIKRHNIYTDTKNIFIKIILKQLEFYKVLRWRLCNFYVTADGYFLF